MKPQWYRTNKYRRHLRAMEFFRLSQNPPAESGMEPTETENIIESPRASGTKSINFSVDEKGKIIVVPIWIIELSRGSQN